MEEMSYVFSFTFFFLLPLIFSLHWWPLAFLILYACGADGRSGVRSRDYQIFLDG